MHLTVILPDTADPAMVDQLTAAVHRLGGQVQPEAADPGADPAAPEGPPEMEQGLGPTDATAPAGPGKPPMRGARANRPPGQLPR